MVKSLRNYVSLSWRELDEGLLLCVLFLMGLGLVQVYSSSFIFATETTQDGLYFFRKQAMFTALAIPLMLFTAMMPWHWIKRMAWVCLAVAVVGIALTYVPGIGLKMGGAHRWIQLPLGFRFEPSELFKISFPFLIAWILTAPAEKPHLRILQFALVAVPLGLLLEQPDFGSFVICLAVAFGLWFAFGLKWTYLMAAGFIAVPTFYFLVIQVPYRHARIKAFLDPWSDPVHKGFQVIQSMLSFHSGGLWGVGLGQGQGKLFFLPEAHTDFTLAVLGEEMGFVGFFLVLSLYGFIIFKALQLALRLQQPEKRAIVLGICLVLAFQIFINMGVALGFLPPKGLTLPFLSYGGSSLLCSALAVGWLLNFARQSRMSFASEASPRRRSFFAGKKASPREKFVMDAAPKRRGSRF